RRAGRGSVRGGGPGVVGRVGLAPAPAPGFRRPPDGEAADDSLRNSITRSTNPFTALGWPALALPCGHAEQGLPASIQLVGRPGTDAFVLAAGLALEARVAG